MVKIYADTSRGAQPCDLQVGDQVLLNQKKSNNLSTNFQPEPCVSVERKGNGGDSVRTKESERSIP